MVLHKCILCEKTFNKKSLYKWHTEGRKKPCIIKETLVYNFQNTDQLKKNNTEFYFENEILEQQNNYDNYITNNRLIDIITDKNKTDEKLKEKTTKNIDPYTLNLEINKNSCKYCNKIFYKKYGVNRHLKICKTKNDVVEQLKTENDILKQNTEKSVNNDENNNENYITNNRLIDIITDKNKTIEKLKEEKTDNIIVIEKKEHQVLILNDIVITSRIEDNYVNATQLCQAGNKKFNDWFRLDTTKELINVLESETGIPASKLLDIIKGGDYKKQGSWIHPDLSIQIAQWISPKFSIQVSKWIRTLFTIGHVDVNIEVLKEKEKEIIIKDKKIQLLEDLYVQKQKRHDYSQENIIYILTTEDNKKKRIYIIGKTTSLKNRLSTYNKTSEHEVVYYKGCKTKEDMDLIEQMVIKKLKMYKEKANRDRFILPIEKDITFFKDIVDISVNFF